jgi:hypothetical protein
MKQTIKRSKKEERGLMLGDLKHDNTIIGGKFKTYEIIITVGAKSLNKNFRNNN